MSEFVRRKIDRDEVRLTVGMRILEEYTMQFDGTTYCQRSPNPMAEIVTRDP